MRAVGSSRAEDSGAKASPRNDGSGATVSATEALLLAHSTTNTSAFLPREREPFQEVDKVK